MELSDLEVFRAVVEAGGVSRAAERLHRVPSGVTTRVRRLEEELGVTLFVRDGNRLILAPAGAELLDYAERLLTLSAEARAALHSTTPHGRLRLGAMESAAAVRLPGPLAEFHRRHPGVTVELRTGPSGPLVSAVLAGELDAALVADPDSDPRLSAEPLFTEELVLVTARAHPPINTPHDLSDTTLLTFADGCTYRRHLTSWLADASVLPGRLVEIGSYHAMLGCVVAGMGAALLPRSVLATLPARRQARVHALPGRRGRTVTRLVRRRGVSSANVEALGEMLRAGRVK